MIVNLIANLLTYAPTQPNELVTVLGYNTVDDGGGGQFYWDNTSAESVNGGTIFSALGSGRWKRLFEDTVNVKWFGAKGDGSSNDTTAIQNAINASKDVFFPDGNYLITGQISLSKDLKIRGGRNATIKKSVNGDIFFTFFYTSGFSLDIAGITFDGGLDASRSYWKVVAPTSLIQYRCSVDKASTFIYAENAPFLSINNCRFNNIHGDGIYVASVGEVNITDSTFSNMETDAAVKHWTAGVLRVDNCTFKEIGSLPASFFVDGVLQAFDQTNKYFTVFGDAIACFTGNVFVNNCYFRNIERLAVAHDLNTGFAESQSVISDNIIVYNSTRLRNSNPPGGIWCELVKNAIITGNKFQMTARSLDEVRTFRGIHFTSADYDDCKVIISGNAMEAEAFNGTLSSGVTAAVLKSSSKVVIADNIIKGPFVNGVEIGSSSELQIDSSCNITGNIISLTGSSAAAVIRLDAFFNRLPKSILISNNTLWSTVDNATSTPTQSGQRMIHLGSVGTGYDPNITLAISGNNMNGGTFEAKGFKIAQLNISNNINLGGIEVDGGSASTLTVISIHGNTIVKDSIFRFAAGSFIGNRCSGTVTFSGMAGLHVASNSFNKPNGPCIVTDADVDFVRSAIVNNIFALYSVGTTGIDIRFSGTGSYFGLHITGNMFAGNTTASTIGIKYGIPANRFFGVVADNRFSELTVTEQNRTLNTNS
jgi:hypothetical protein